MSKLSKMCTDIIVQAFKIIFVDTINNFEDDWFVTILIKRTNPKMPLCVYHWFWWVESSPIQSLVIPIDTAILLNIKFLIKVLYCWQRCIIGFQNSTLHRKLLKIVYLVQFETLLFVYELYKVYSKQLLFHRRGSSQSASLHSLITG